jgi:hypothetical protein
VTGHIESWDENSVAVESARIDRKEVVRIGDDGSVADHDPIYSGRSSWYDLQHAEPNRYEHIRLDLKNGLARASNEQADCDGKQIEKPDVIRGSFGEALLNNTKPNRGAQGTASRFPLRPGLTLCVRRWYAEHRLVENAVFCVCCG